MERSLDRLSRCNGNKLILIKFVVTQLNTWELHMTVMGDLIGTFSIWDKREGGRQDERNIQ